MNLPTEGEVYAKLMELLREAQSCCAQLSHLTGLNDKKVISKGWLIISEQLKLMQRTVTHIATGKMN